jgi:GNAT superfamily N-acetyltransferase
MLQQNYVIKPIFNQKANPNLWDDFVDIETAARAQHGHIFMYGAYASIIDNYYNAYENFDNNVVFCAYINDALVGFISGYQLEAGDFYLDSLFVRPEYQGRGVGKNLLVAFEHATNLFHANIHGVSYSWATGFYKHQSYNIKTNAQDTQIFNKKLKRPTAGIYPIFKWNIGDFRVKQMANADTLLLHKSKHRPIAVYVNEKQEIDSVGLITKNGTEQLYFNDKLLPDIRELRQKQILDYLLNSK